MTCPHLWQEFHLQQPSPSMFHLGFIKARSSKVELKTSGRIGIDEKPWVVLKMVNPIYIYILIIICFTFGKLSKPGTVEAP